MTTLISDEYKSELFKRHTTDPEYGGEFQNWIPQISSLINHTHVDEILDYGSGSGGLGRNLVLDRKIAVHLYDPGIPELDEPPEPRQMCVCVNVLEEVEDDCIESVLDDLQRCTGFVSFISIKETSEKPMEWWLLKIMDRFCIQSLVRADDEFFVISQTKIAN